MPDRNPTCVSDINAASHPQDVGLSVWPVAQISPAVQRRGRYVTGSGYHPARMLPHLAAYAIARYTRAGDIVLDPLAGIGTTLVEAIHLGRHAIGVELETAWVALAKANIVHARTHGGTGTGRIVHADATHLPTRLVRELRGRVSLVLTSPPYGRSTHGRVEHRHGPLRRFADSYGTPDEANLGHRSRIGLLTGMTEVLTQCRPMLAPDGVIVIPVSPWRRDHLLVDLPGQLALAAVDVGLELYECCIAVHAAYRDGRFIPWHSFWQLSVVRQQRRRGRPLHLPVHEQILVFTNPQPAGTP